MEKITPFLWFNDNAEEAVTYYVTMFPNSRILEIARYGEGESLPAGTLMTARFELDGREYMALNGGPHYKLAPAFSLMVQCGTQEEVDAFWEKLATPGRMQRCGWLTDRFGLTWQIVPGELIAMLQDQDAARKGRVMEAMFPMTKLDLAALRRAYRGE